MAEFNGTGSSNTYGGTSENDIIRGLGGDDDLAGAGGDDTLIGGDGADTLAGGDGDDFFGYEDGENGFAEIDGDVVDGGDDDDTFGLYIVNPTTSIPFAVTTNGGGTISDGSAFSTTVRNVEFIKVLNSGEILTPGEESYLTLSNVVLGNPAASSSEVTIDPEYYTGSTVRTNLFDADGDAGLMVGSTQMFSGDTLTTSMGELTTRFYSSGGEGYWTFELILPDELFYGIGKPEDILIDSVLDVTFTEDNGDTYETPITFGYALDKNVDASAASEGVAFGGDEQDSFIILSNFDDLINAGDGDDTVQAGDGDDEVYAGAMDEGDDSLMGGSGNDILGGAAGEDTLDGGTGNDTLFGGDDADSLSGGENNDVIWSGKGNDETFGETGNDTLGGGEGADNVEGGQGHDLMYASVGNDTLVGDDGDDTLFGGNGFDLLEGRDGDDQIFNGADDDEVYGGDGDDEIWGGGGNDSLWGESGNDTFAFTAATGNDTIFDFELTGSGPTTGDVLDLREYTGTVPGGDSFTYQDVIDLMSDSSGDVLLVLSPGNTITFSGLSVSDFQTAEADWALF